jgi:hypothetical protein
MTTPAAWSGIEVLDVYFLETRAKLLEIAATLDRVDRAAGADGGDTSADPRIRFVQDALKILQGNAGNRAELIQRLYSKA